MNNYEITIVKMTKNSNGHPETDKNFTPDIFFIQADNKNDAFRKGLDLLNDGNYAEIHGSLNEVVIGIIEKDPLTGDFVSKTLKAQAEVNKLQAETRKIDKHVKWYEVVLFMGITTALLAAGKYLFN